MSGGPMQSQCIRRAGATAGAQSADATGRSVQAFDQRIRTAWGSWATLRWDPSARSDVRSGHRPGRHVVAGSGAGETSGMAESGGVALAWPRRIYPDGDDAEDAVVVRLSCRARASRYSRELTSNAGMRGSAHWEQLSLSKLSLLEIDVTISGIFRRITEAPTRMAMATPT
jgi:hypothetical protein